MTVSFHRAMAMMAVVFALFASACSVTEVTLTPVAPPETAADTDPPRGDREVAAPAPEVESDEVPLGDDGLPGVAVDGGGLTGEVPETLPFEDDISVWDWVDQSRPIAQFSAILIPGAVTNEPNWPASVKIEDPTVGSSCVEGDDWFAVRAAFGEATAKVFAVNGELWEFRVLDPRTETDLPLWC